MDAATGSGALSGALRKAAAGIHPVRAKKLAEGGIVTRPTFALIGEAGPEAVIPLGSSGGGVGGGSVTFNFPNYVGSKSELVDLIRGELIRVGRRAPNALGGLA
jgi:SLT domain-containing protein